jgi:hypothetical protein
MGKYGKGQLITSATMSPSWTIPKHNHVRDHGTRKSKENHDLVAGVDSTLASTSLMATFFFCFLDLDKRGLLYLFLFYIKYVYSA